ncbi:MAG: hypothetical protein ACLSVD_15050 [Eggerthellaceae bacterium]
MHSTTGPYYGDFLRKPAAYGSARKPRGMKAVMKAVDAGEDPARRERLRRDGIPSPRQLTTVIDLG